MNTKAIVRTVSKSGTYSFSKENQETIFLLKGLGVEGDIHSGKKVKHRSRIKKNPDTPNLRQVHLMHSELFDEVKEKGFDIKDGQLGENITTRGIDLLNLPKDTILHIGDTAKIQVTGLRNPCAQIESFQKGLLKAVVEKDEDGNIIRKTGIMSIVLESGAVHVGDEIKIELPEEPFIKLERV